MTSSCSPVAMEIEETDKIEVKTDVTKLVGGFTTTNTVSVFIHNMIRDFTEIESGRETHLDRERFITLEARDFTPSHLSELLRGQEVDESQCVGERMARNISQALSNEKSLGERVLLTVHLIFVKERRLVLPSNIPAPLEVLERLMEQHRVDLKGENEAQCSICHEDISMSLETIIEMPKCLHRFHEKCLFEWLSRKNSCPMCRSSVGRGFKNSG